MSRYAQFDMNRLQLRPIAERGHDLVVDQIFELKAPSSRYVHPELEVLISKIVDARNNDAPVILMMGAHPIKLGLSRFLIDLMRRRVITHLAMNGAGVIHDYELATVGGTSENVAKWIAQGQFGLWQETSNLNECIAVGKSTGEGLGEVVGRLLTEQQAPHRDVSLCAAGWEFSVPVTCHLTVGADIIHGMPNACGAALGQTSFTDFQIFAESVSRISGGVFLNLGTAVTGPEVFLKALSMARNVARQHQATVTGFTTAVFDLLPLPSTFRDGPPRKEHPQYYYRPWKTLLCRTVADSGDSYYFQGDHRATIPTLWSRLSKSDLS